MTLGPIRIPRRWRPRAGLLLALAVSAPALALAQAQGATSPTISLAQAPSGIETWTERRAAPESALPGAQGAALQNTQGPMGLEEVTPGRDVPAGDRGSLNDNFRQVPRDEAGRLREYEPPKPERRPSVAMEGARLKVLDKMTGQVDEIDLKVGETRVEDRLELALLTCRAPEEDVRQDAFAYLEIRDLREDAPRFAGWMFASSPALSAMDHARYDVWVLSCNARPGEASPGSE
ncbi:DUF2155 domain-containing protein [Albimonas pacifica]|uniref:DUF2155 domain-containing protein n=1 Tax=Albimonas pacifica TaxID=1114924 RepID=A0A1I3NPC9_9RHOB|nr:DUF2155 domain-containing protein [Albimonas pacifica]SFJ11153.1 hypothetical protein SAMN05216258_11419 [Albimonas pacifica]